MKFRKKQKKKCGTEINISVFIVEDMFQRVVQMHILLKGRNGGLGTKENIVTLCPECHFQEDLGQDTKLYEEYIENYLKGIYGTNWSKENLIFKKY